MVGENPVLALVRLYWTPLALSLILLAITALVWATGEVTYAYKENVKGYAAWTGRLPRLWNVFKQ